MDNYKIINTHTNEIIKALNELGYVWTPKKFDEQDCLLKAHWILAKEKGEIAYSSGTHIDSPLVFKELTIPQLRDLVVLKRNDKADGNYKHRDGSIYYITSDNEFYLFDGRAWLKSLIETSEHLIEIEKPQPQDPALISGRDAWLADFDGKKVQFKNIGTGNDQWFPFESENWDHEDLKSGSYQFRLKPQTIKLELELPKPFDPKNNDWVWTISGVQEGGITQMLHRDGNDYPLGAWRTEAEAKQVVEQLRKIRGAS